MEYEEWEATVPRELKDDALWRLQVYRLSAYAADIAWQDALTLSKTGLTRDLASQLYHAVCSVSAHIAEGYSHSSAGIRSQFLEHSIGSAREARDWYYKAGHVLAEEVTSHRIGLLTRIVKTLITLTSQQRRKELREAAEAQKEEALPEPPLIDEETALS